MDAERSIRLALDARVALTASPALLGAFWVMRVTPPLTFCRSMSFKFVMVLSSRVLG